MQSYEDAPCWGQNSQFVLNKIFWKVIDIIFMCTLVKIVRHVRLEQNFENFFEADPEL